MSTRRRSVIGAEVHLTSMLEFCETRVMLSAQTFSVVGGTSITEDPTDGDNNAAGYTISYTGSLGTGESASVDVSHTLNQTSSSDYAATAYSAIATAVANTPGTSFNSSTGTLTFSKSTSTTTVTATAYPSSATDAADGDESWSNLSNATGNNASNAASLTGLYHRDTANTIRLKSFGLNIPTGATITGIKVTLTTTGSNNSASAVKLTKNGTAAVGTAPAPSGSWSSGTVIHGSSTSLWGTTWTAADLNSANFGLLVQPDPSSGSSNNYYIYNAAVEVTYTTSTTVSPTSLTFSLPVVNDNDVEGDESYSIGIANAASTSSGGASIATGTAATTIVDNDVSFAISGGGTVTELASDGDNNQATFTVGYSGTLTSGKTAGVTVAHTLNQTASGDFSNTLNSAVAAAISAGANGVSYNSSTGVLTFSGGAGNATSLTFSLAVNDDATVESDEQFSIQLSNASATSPFSATLGSSSANSTIVSDDIPNDPPVFDETEYAFPLKQDDPTGTVVGSISATDPDAGATLTYSGPISSSEPFEIDAETGEITFVGTTAPSVGQRELTFLVTDQYGATDTVSVDIDVVYRPVITSLELFADPEQDGVVSQPIIQGYLEDDGDTNHLTIEFDMNGDGTPDGSSISSSGDTGDFLLNLMYFNSSSVPNTRELISTGTYTVYVRAGEAVEGYDAPQFGNWTSITFTYEEPDFHDPGTQPNYTNSATDILDDVAEEYDGIDNFSHTNNPANPNSSATTPSGISVPSGVLNPGTFVTYGPTQVVAPGADYLSDAENQDAYMQQQGERAGLFSGSSGGSFVTPSHSTMEDYKTSQADAPALPPQTSIDWATGYSPPNLIPSGFEPDSNATETLDPDEPSTELPSDAWTLSNLPGFITAGQVTGVGTGDNPGPIFPLQNSSAAAASAGITSGTSTSGNVTTTASITASGLQFTTPPTPQFANSTNLIYYTQELTFEIQLTDTSGNELNLYFAYGLGGWTELLLNQTGTFTRWDEYTIFLASGTQATPGGLQNLWNVAQANGVPGWEFLTNFFSTSGEYSTIGDFGYNYFQNGAYRNLNQMASLGHSEVIVSGHVGESFTVAPVAEDSITKGTVSDWYSSVLTDNVSPPSANPLYLKLESESFTGNGFSSFVVNNTTGAFGLISQTDTVFKHSLQTSLATSTTSGSITHTENAASLDVFYVHEFSYGIATQSGTGSFFYLKDARRTLLESSGYLSTNGANATAMGTAGRLQDWIYGLSVGGGQVIYDVELYADNGIIVNSISDSVSDSSTSNGFTDSHSSAYGQTGTVIWSNASHRLGGTTATMTFTTFSNSGFASYTDSVDLDSTITLSGTGTNHFDSSGSNTVVSGSYTDTTTSDYQFTENTASWNSNGQIVGGNLSGYIVQANADSTNSITISKGLNTEYQFNVAGGQTFDNEQYAGGTIDSTYSGIRSFTGFNTITASDSYTIPVGYELYFDPGEGQRSAGNVKSGTNNFTFISGTPQNPMEVPLVYGLFDVQVESGTADVSIQVTSGETMTLAAGAPLSAAVHTPFSQQNISEVYTGYSPLFDGTGGARFMPTGIENEIEDWLTANDL